VTSISAGSGSACIDLACTGGPVLTLSPTPQGSLAAGTNTVDVVGASITGIDTQVAGPLTFSPAGAVAGVALNPSVFPAQQLTSSSCVTVSGIAYCGATFRFDTTVLGSGTNYVFLTFNLQAYVPEPSVAALLAVAAFALVPVLGRSR
jgi:hypothetical protein